jgi:TonB family protein
VTEFPAHAQAPDSAASESTSEINTEGIDFPYPGYLSNIVRQATLRFEGSDREPTLSAEVTFLLHRDGTISNLRFLKRSGVYAFDLDAQESLEAAAEAHSFGPLPTGFGYDVLPVILSFGAQAAATKAGSTPPEYFEFQVEKTVLGVPGNPQPQYPSMLQSAGVEGRVLAQFVVDVDGTADMSTFKVLESSHELFTESVRQVLPRMRFFPAEAGGKKVRQVMQLPFVFGLNK